MCANEGLVCASGTWLSNEVKSINQIFSQKKWNCKTEKQEKCVGCWSLELGVVAAVSDSVKAGD